MSVQPYLETEARFLQNRRTSMLAYLVYEDKVSFAIEVFAVHEEPLEDHMAHPENASGLAALFVSSHGAASTAVEYGHLQYSAGADMGHLAAWLSRTLEYWETFASYQSSMYWAISTGRSSGAAENTFRSLKYGRCRVHSSGGLLRPGTKGATIRSNRPSSG